MSDTVELHWPRESTFLDQEADLRFPGSGTYEVPADLEAFYRTRGWTDPPDDEDDDAETPASAANPNQDGPTRDELEGADPDDVLEDESGDDESDGGDSGN